MKIHLHTSLLLSLFLTPVLAQSITVDYLGVQTVPTGTTVGGVEIGGLSGIFYDPYADTFTAISDDSRSTGASRMWNLGLDYNGTSFSAVTVNSRISIKSETGAFLTKTDAEGIAGNLDGSYFVSNEGVANGTSPNISPWIWRFNAATGNKEAEVSLPEKFLPRDASGQAVPPDDENQTSGVRSNLSLECLGITPSRKILFTANEAALVQDYSGTYDSDFNQANNSKTRIVRFSGVPGNPTSTEEKFSKPTKGHCSFLSVDSIRYPTSCQLMTVGRCSYWNAALRKTTPTSEAIAFGSTRWTSTRLEPPMSRALTR